MKKNVNWEQLMEIDQKVSQVDQILEYIIQLAETPYNCIAKNKAKEAIESWKEYLEEN